MAKPAKTWRNKGIDIAAWQNDEGRVSFTMRKSYLNKQTNTWTDTKYLYQDDLRALVELLEQAIAWNSGNAADREEHKWAAVESGSLSAVIKETVKAVKLDEDDMIPF
jgi:hypothetical protein